MAGEEADGAVMQRPDSRKWLPTVLYLAVHSLASTALAEGELDLLQAITIPFEDPKHVYFAESEDASTAASGSPSYGIRSGSNIMTPFGLLYPSREMFRDFVIRARFKPADDQGGFLFAIVDPMGRQLQLGVKIHPAKRNEQNVSVFYGTEQGTQKLERPIGQQWTKFNVQVNSTTSEFSLRVNCDAWRTMETSSASSGHIGRLHFDLGATLYIGQAGPTFKGAFEGVLQQLDVVQTPPQRRQQKENECGVEREQLQEKKETDRGDDLAVTEGTQRKDASEGLLEAFSSLNLHSLEPAELRHIKSLLKGDKGPMGPRGPPGKSIQGPPGLPGPPGRPAIVTVHGSTSERAAARYNASFRGGAGCGCTESTFLNLANQIRDLMPAGPPGIMGRDGIRGPPGQTGVRGSPGPRGAKGDSGLKGDRGERGAPGSEGPQGQKGEPGKDGHRGIRGAPGLPGPPGSPGLASGYDPAWKPRSAMFQDGSQGGSSRPSKSLMASPALPGPKGDRGPVGLIGPKGFKGEPGPKGTRGDPGLMGPQGERGYEGPMGPPGYKGDIGDPGIDGTPGLPGTPGLSGLKGEKGARGDPGPPAMVAATYGMAAAGYASTARGPQGPKGEKGEPGSYGPKGTSGHPGMPGKPGLRGPIGPAIDLTKLDESQLKLLRGKRGKRGKRGPPGLPGPPGTPPQQLRGKGSAPDAPASASSSSDPLLDLRNLSAEGVRCDLIGSVAAAVVKSDNVEALLSDWDACVPGTLAYAKDEEAVLVRVEAGWQHLLMGTLVTSSDWQEPKSNNGS